MDAIECMKKRRSIRAYDSRPVAKELIEQLIDCARFAPTARGEEPWEFVVVLQEETRRKLAGMTDFGKHIAQAPVCIAVFCRDTKYYLEDGCAATQNIMLAATANGLGTCWIAGDKKAYAPKAAELLGVPAGPPGQGFRLVSLISVGYPAEQPAKKKRPLSQVLHWEKF